MQLNLLPSTVANADIGSLKSLNTLFDKYLDHLLVIFEQNCVVQTTGNLELFDKKKKQKQKKTKKKRFFFKNHFGQSFDAILEDDSVAETIV